MTNDSGKGEIIVIAIGWLLVALVIVLFIGLLIWAWNDDRRQAEALKPTTNTTLLPIIAGPFKQESFIVYELQHGWMVREYGGISSLTFVPKPSKQE